MQNKKFNNVKVKIGQTLTLTIKKLGINGEGIGYYKKKITFVDGALPDELVVVKVTAVSDKFISAKLVKIKEKSPYRVKPRDPFADTVGGFELEHLNYQQQLEFKRDIIIQALEKYKPKNWHNITIKDTIGMDNPYYYRNKAQFPIRKVNGQLCLGMYKKNSHDLVDLPEVHTQHPLVMQIIRKIKDFVEELDISIYDEKSHSGQLKTIIVRISEASKQAQVTFVSNSSKLDKIDDLISLITDNIPEVVSINLNINPAKSSLIWGDKTNTIWGEKYIKEEILDKEFLISARAFLQLNHSQTESLYEEAIYALQPQKQDIVLDAYSGVGTIGISLADFVKEVRGMEIIPEAVKDAKQNVLLNKQTNISYEVGSADTIFKKFRKENWNPTAIVVDPPRTGLEDDLITEIIKSNASKLVYISCNESTLAKDLVKLSKHFKVHYIQPIDMFPQTARWEGVVKLTR